MVELPTFKQLYLFSTPNIKLLSVRKLDLLLTLNIILSGLLTESIMIFQRKYIYQNILPTKIMINKFCTQIVPNTNLKIPIKPIITSSVGIYLFIRTHLNPVVFSNLPQHNRFHSNSHRDVTSSSTE